jgi:hypothetical protein
MRFVSVRLNSILWDFNLAHATEREAQLHFAVVKSLHGAGCNVSLETYFRSNIEAHERRKAEIEGWILGVS